MKMSIGKGISKFKCNTMLRDDNFGVKPPKTPLTASASILFSAFKEYRLRWTLFASGIITVTILCLTVSSWTRSPVALALSHAALSEDCTRLLKQSAQADTVLASLQRAEQVFQENMARRQKMARSVACTTEGTCADGNPLYLLREILTLTTYDCPYEIFLGPFGEGGKWLCNIPDLIQNGSSVVYSVGSNGETEFEEEVFSKFQIQSDTFDPTNSAIRWPEKVFGQDYMTFHKIGLTGLDNPDDARAQTENVMEGATFMRVEQIMESLNHTFVDVFKIDCEGCEIGVMKSVKEKFNRQNPPFGQVLMEIHCLKDVKESRVIYEAMETLGYRLFHSEPNFYNVQCCFELAYIHESLIIGRLQPSN